MLDIQKASLLKRVSAFILDAILLCILSVGFGSLISAITGFDSHMQTMDACYAKYEAAYGVDFDITPEAYDAMTQAEKDQYLAAKTALTADEEAQYAYNMIISLSLTVVSMGILLAYLALEFAVPLLIGNGQTIGKRIFALGVIRSDCVQVNAVTLFVRTVLGKYTIGTMVPVLMIMMIMLGTIGILGPTIVMGVATVQAVCVFFTANHSAIQDLLANTVVVDISSQRVFANETELLRYKERIHAEKAARQDY